MILVHLLRNKSQCHLHNFRILVSKYVGQHIPCMDLQFSHRLQSSHGHIRGLGHKRSENRGSFRVTHLAQGTLYPDVIESVSFRGPSATIKSHHNVGGLPERLNLELLEPLRELFKDEVRQLGKALGLPDKMVSRHPFPGPGLAVRILGPVSREDRDLLQKVDRVYIDYLRENDLYDEIWQAFAVLLPLRTVGVMGDERTYDRVVALRAVTSIDGMTADWYRMDPGHMAAISSRIVNRVNGVSRIVYDISSKPPGTIEWE